MSVGFRLGVSPFYRKVSHLSTGSVVQRKMSLNAGASQHLEIGKCPGLSTPESDEDVRRGSGDPPYFAGEHEECDVVGGIRAMAELGEVVAAGLDDVEGAPEGSAAQHFF